MMLGLSMIEYPCVTMLLLLVLGGCNHSGKESKIPIGNAQSTPTVCLGRHMIDIPNDFSAGDGAGGIFTVPNKLDSQEPWEFQLRMESASMSRSDFQHRINSRQAYLQRLTSGKVDRVTEARDIGQNAHIIHINNINQAYSSELHVFIEGHYLVASVESYHDQLREAEAQLIGFTKNIAISAPSKVRPVKKNEYCLGALTIIGDFKEEHGTLLLRSQRHPDITINLTSDTYIPDARKTLIQRVDERKSLLRTLKRESKVIREGELQVASMKAQEWLGWMMLGDGEDRHKQYGFKLQTMRPDPSPAKPQISIELVAGAPEAGGTPRPLSLDEPELVTLWDRVTRSLRPAAGFE